MGFASVLAHDGICSVLSVSMLSRRRFCANDSRNSARFDASFFARFWARNCDIAFVIFKRVFKE